MSHQLGLEATLDEAWVRSEVDHRVAPPKGAEWQRERSSRRGPSSDALTGSPTVRDLDEVRTAVERPVRPRLMRSSVLALGTHSPAVRERCLAWTWTLT